MLKKAPEENHTPNVSNIVSNNVLPNISGFTTGFVARLRYASRVSNIDARPKNRIGSLRGRER